MRSYEDWAKGIWDFRLLEKMLYYRYNQLHYYDDNGLGITEELSTEEKAKVRNEIKEIIDILDGLMYAYAYSTIKEIKKLQKRSMKYLTPKKLKNLNIYWFPLGKRKSFRKS